MQSLVSDSHGSGRRLIVVSGYYGFANLGDEAILEELTNELKRLAAPDEIVILSNNPQNTAAAYGVASISRWQPFVLINLLFRTRLFISGGGGLFQDTTSIKSVVYYACQILLARILQVPVLIYAQGIGPLNTANGRRVTKLALAQASKIAVRDSASAQLLKEWKIDAQLTADPVWALVRTEPPESIKSTLASGGSKNSMTVGLSLRESANFSDHHLKLLITALHENLPPDSLVILLPLQNEQDSALLAKFEQAWQALGRSCLTLDTKLLQLPSQWVGVLNQCDLVVAMRLHALILSLKSGTPVVGIAYDPKVRHVMTEFEQPILILAKDDGQNSDALKWSQTVRMALDNRERLTELAGQHEEAAKIMACQNFDILARILNMQSDQLPRS